MLVAVCSGRGSPGSTTTSLVLGASWAGRAVVVEADPSGGDLGLRLRRRGLPLPESPTVLSLVSAARKDPNDRDLVVSRALELTRELGVVPAHRYAELAAALAGFWEPLALAMAASSVDVVADIGRTHAGSVAMPVLQAADVVVVVGRPDFVGATHLVDRIAQLSLALSRSASDARIWPVLVGPGRHQDGNTADLRMMLAQSRLSVAGVGYLAHDPDAVARLEAGEDPQGRLGRTPLIRTGQMLAGDLASTGEPAWPPASTPLGSLMTREGVQRP